MKKILIITFLFLCLTSNAQEFQTESKAIVGNFEVAHKNTSELFASINNWIALDDNPSRDVQLNDLETGKIIIKGINEISYKSLARALDPTNKNIPEFSSLKFNHLIEIRINDNGYKIIYHLVDFVSENVKKNNLFFNCINLNHTNELAIREYNKKNDLFLTEGLVGKKKRENYRALAKRMFKDINNTLLFDLKQTMAFIEQSVLNSNKIEL
jgi:hypothetical protein